MAPAIACCGKRSITAPTLMAIGKSPALPAICQTRWVVKERKYYGKFARFFSAALATESNTFSPIAIDRRGFEASLYARPGTHPETPTLCSAVIPLGRKWAKEKQWTFIEGTAAWADPAGIINQRAFESLRDEILDQIKQAMPLDAVALGLHGAMVAAGYDDPEGDLLKRVRDIVGEDCVVCATFDPHSQLTQKRVDQLDFFMAFKEFPHTDFVDRAEDLYRILDGTLSGALKPIVSVFDCKMIDVFPTSREPMRSFVDKMFALEQSDDDVLSLSLIHGFMASDVPEMGTKMVVITNDQPEKGKELSRELGLEVFAMRGKSMPEQPDEKAAVAEALSTATSAKKNLLSLRICGTILAAARRAMQRSFWMSLSAVTQPTLPLAPYGTPLLCRFALPLAKGQPFHYVLAQSRPL